MPRRKTQTLEEFQQINLKKHQERQRAKAEKEKKLLEEEEQLRLQDAEDDNNIDGSGHNYIERKSPRKKEAYVRNADLVVELRKWKESADDPAERIPSEALGEMILKIATRLMNHANFVRYSQEIKNDIISSACYRVIKSLPNYNFEFNNPFAYITQICWSAAVTYLGKYYKDLNMRRELMKDSLKAMSNIEGVNINRFYNQFLNQVIGEENMTDDDREMLESLPDEPAKPKPIFDEENHFDN